MFTTAARLTTPLARRAAAGAHLTGPRSITTEAKPTASPGFWKSLSPKTRRNIGYLAAVSAITDAAVVYEYPEKFGLAKKE